MTPPRLCPLRLWAPRLWLSRLCPPRRWLSLLLAVLLLGGGSACDPAPRTIRETHYVFGTLVTFVLRDAQPAQARAAIGEVLAHFRRWHRDWHAWRPGELTRLNAALAAGEAMAVSADLLALITVSRELHLASEGLFDPGIGAVIAAWGFHADTPPTGDPPSPAVIAALMQQRPSMGDVVIDGNRISSRNRAVRLDFGGIAKGFALDRADAILRRHGIRHAVINAGGDLNTTGQAGRRPWRIGIRHPIGWGAVGSVTAGDGETVYTSGNYERYREVEGVRLSHILDPRTGQPVRHVASVTVIHDSGTLADAAATALAVAAPDRWPEIARRLGVQAVLRITDSNRVEALPAMAARFQPEKSIAVTVVR